MNRSAKIVIFTLLVAILVPLAVTADGNTSLSNKQVVNYAYMGTPVQRWSFCDQYDSTLWFPEGTFMMNEAEWAPWDPWWAFPNTWYYGDNSWNWRPLLPPWSMSPLGRGYDSWYGGWYGYSPDGYPLGIPEYVGSTLFQDTQYAKGWRFTHRDKKKVEATTQKKAPAVSKAKVKAVAKKKAPAVSRKSARIDEIKNELKIKDRSDPGSYGMPNNQGRNIQNSSTVKNPTVKKRHGKNEPSIGSGSSKTRPPKVKKYYPPGNSGGTVVTPPPAPPRPYRRRHKSN